MRWKLLTILLCTVAITRTIAAGTDYRIIVTTAGYKDIYNYDSRDFVEKAARDLRITVPVELSETYCPSDTSTKMVSISVGAQVIDFALTDKSPVIRLVYDRNRRTLTGTGFNYLEKNTNLVEAPVFKGTPICELQTVFEKDVDRHIIDRSLLSTDSSTLFLLEVDIDENGIVQRITELNGAYKQYSKIIIDRFYDKAYRGWEPAKVNGVPCRSLAQFTFELKREPLIQSLDKN